MNKYAKAGKAFKVIKNISSHIYRFLFYRFSYDKVKVTARTMNASVCRNVSIFLYFISYDNISLI